MKLQVATNELAISDKELIGYLDNLGLTQKLTAGEKNTFLQISKAFQLNPFKREIYASKFGDNFSLVVGFEVYLKRAERSGLLDGWEIKSEGSVSDSSLKAIITIYRKDRSRPFIHEVYYNEYVQMVEETEYVNGTKRKLGTFRPNKFWKEKPITMIKKVAMGQGFRLCFSDELGGMPYTAEEITDEATFEVVSTQQPIVIDTTKDHIDKINAAQSLDELKNIFTAIPKNEANSEVIAAKDAMKIKLTPNE